MSVLDRAALETSPLADLHAIASELSMDGYRRLRKADLIDAIIARQDGEEATPSPEARPAPRSRARKTPAPESSPDQSPESSSADEPEESGDSAEEGPGTASRRRRGRRGGRGRGSGAGSGRESATSSEAAGEVADEVPTSKDAPAAEAEGEVVEGVVELLANGSGFVRVSPPDPSDDDVYVSAAQVRRCDLVSGDRVSGPKRLPRRSERFASLIRVDSINGRPATEQAEAIRYDDLPAAFPADRFRLGSEDPTLKAFEWLTPFGRGSRVTIVGAARAGKSHALRQLAEALAAEEGTTELVALAGVRPEELSEWATGTVTPTAAVDLGASSDAQDHAVELVVEQARRLAARGSDAVLLIDTLDGLHTLAARRALAAARNIVDGGSLTVIATSTEPVGGETTVIALDVLLTSTGRFPAIDLVASGTLRPELLVGEVGATAIAEARAQALGA